MLEQLKQSVYEANMFLARKGLVILTWGNASGIDRGSGLIAIKPSGVDYDTMTADDMVIVDLDGKTVEGKYKPSSDTPTHTELYKAFPAIGGVAHTHSINATAFAQSYMPLYGAGIIPLGTTHADYFNGTIPLTRGMTKKEIETDYEKNTGLVIAETINRLKTATLHMPACLVKSHGPFTWGKDAMEAAHNSYILENVAELAFKTYLLSMRSEMVQMSGDLLNKHFSRKHGKDAYYGQK